MGSINKDIKNGNYKRVYLLYGPETYLRDQYSERIRENAVDSSDTMNITRFSGKDTDEKKLIAVCGTVPFFGDRRLVIVRDSGFFKSGGHDKLAEYIKDIPETTVLVFIEDSVDGRNKLFKAVKTAGMAAEFETPSEKMLVRWLYGMVKDSGKNIRESTLVYFISQMKPDMNWMHQEMEKLIAYTGEREVIEDKDVDAVCSVYIENKVYDMVLAAAEKDRTRALKLYGDLLALRIQPMQILPKLNYQLKQMYEIRSMIPGTAVSVIASRTGSRDFVVKKYLPLCRKFSSEEILEAVRYGVNMEEDIKSGRMGDRLGVEMMLIKISAPLHT
ncbi:MAG: DNA polymerase III subunit delta [Lachnospiraceae bacterium]|nr:DNA polymerase III subunit delta [Lachnospiraceae bacterium]